MTSPPVSASYTAKSSVLGKNLLTLRTMLSNAFHVQGLLGATNASEAAERIFIGCLPAPADGKQYTLAELNQYRPFILIGPASNLAIRARHESVGGSWTHGRQGETDIFLERAHPNSGRDDQDDFAWIDLIDTIRQSNDVAKPGLIELHEGEGYLSIRMIEILEIWRGEPEEAQSVGDYQSARMRVHWGRI